MFKRLFRIYRILLYQLSKEKKELDWYMKKLRQGQRLADIEVSRLQELIKLEKLIYAK